MRITRKIESRKRHLKYIIKTSQQQNTKESYWTWYCPSVWCVSLNTVVMMQLAFEVILTSVVSLNWFSMCTVMLCHYIPQENQCEYISVIWNPHEDVNIQVCTTQITLSSGITHTIINLQAHSVFERAGRPQHMKLVVSHACVSFSCHSMVLQSL